MMPAHLTFRRAEHYRHLKSYWRLETDSVRWLTLRHFLVPSGSVKLMCAEPVCCNDLDDPKLPRLLAEPSAKLRKRSRWSALAPDIVATAID
jgi:hypothetical protein